MHTRLTALRKRSVLIRSLLNIYERLTVQQTIPLGINSPLIILDRLAVWRI